MIRIYASSAMYDLEGLVSDDVDLDGTFILMTDDGERLKVNGWLFTVEVVEC